MTSCSRVLERITKRTRQERLLFDYLRKAIAGNDELRVLYFMAAFIVKLKLINPDFYRIGLLSKMVHGEIKDKEGK